MPSTQVSCLLPQLLFLIFLSLLVLLSKCWIRLGHTHPCLTPMLFSNQSMLVSLYMASLPPLSLCCLYLCALIISLACFCSVLYAFLMSLVQFFCLVLASSYYFLFLSSPLPFLNPLCSSPHTLDSLFTLSAFNLKIFQISLTGCSWLKWVYRNFLLLFSFPSSFVY